MNRSRTFLLCVALAGCGSGSTATLASGTLEEHVAARAVVEPTGGVTRIAAPWTARVLRVAVDVGDTVGVGTELAELDRDELEPDVLVAPVAGVVIARHASVGDDVSRADGPLFEIADPSAIRLRIELEDGDASRVSPGAGVEVLAAGDALATTSIARISPRMEPRAIDPDGQLVRAAFAPLEAGPAFPLGRVVDVSIALPPREVAVLAPRAAVVIRDGRTVVRLPGGLFDGERVVEVGAVDAEHVEIVGGVSAGTVVRVEP